MSTHSNLQSLAVIDRLRSVDGVFETQTISIGQRLWHMTAASSQSRLLELADDAEELPCGYLLWESAVALAEFLAREPHRVRAKRVLELGAGVGLPSLVARSLGADVWLTDHDAGVLEIAHNNARRNDISGIESFVADWRAWPEDQQYDLILGADIVYDREMWPALETVLRLSLSPGGQVVLADPQRADTLGLLSLLEQRGWSIDLAIQPVSLPRATSSRRTVDVSLVEIVPA